MSPVSEEKRVFFSLKEHKNKLNPLRDLQIPWILFHFLEHFRVLSIHNTVAEIDIFEACKTPVSVAFKCSDVIHLELSVSS